MPDISANNIIEVVKDGHHIVFITRNGYKYYALSANVDFMPAITESKMNLYWNIQNKPYIEICNKVGELSKIVHVNSTSYKEQHKWFVDERFNI